MNSTLYTIGMVAIWCFNLLNGTGLGQAYRTNEIAVLMTGVLMLICVVQQVMKEGDISVEPKYFYTIFIMFAVFIGVSYLNDRGLDGIMGFWVYMLVYIMSRIKITANAQRLTSICYGVLGLALLYIFNYLDVLDGWNANSIAMIGLYSYLVFMIPFYGMTDWRSLMVLPMVSAAYVYLIWPTDSRSCIIVVIAMMLFVLRIIPVKKLLASSRALFVVLLVPLFVAIFICVLSKFGDLSGLAAWSQEIFEKDLFNGRDTIWMEGFTQLFERPLFGNGYVTSGRWHNSAIACLTAFGVVGYFLWTRVFHLILNEGRPYLDDVCVVGSMVAFLALACHQSVELGIFAPSPSCLPYIVLGIVLGRVNCLRSEERCLR